MARIEGIHSKGPNTNWIDLSSSFAFSASFGTVSNKSIFVRREGDSLLIKGYFLSTSPTASIAYITLPSAYHINLAKVAANKTPLGTAQASSDNSNINYFSTGVSFVPYSDGTTDSAIYFADKTGAGNHIYAGQNGNGMAQAPYGFHFDIKVPISGWSANDILKISDDSKF